MLLLCFVLGIYNHCLLAFYKARNPADLSTGFFLWGVWRCPTFTWVSILSSALGRFTVLFGMGRRGTNPLWPPDIKLSNQKAFILVMLHSSVSFIISSVHLLMYEVLQMIESSLTSN